MPDGDRFEWRLRGKKWRTVFRLLSSRADKQLAAEEAVKGVAAYLRDHADIPCNGLINAVHESLSAPQLPILPPESGLGATGLMLQLDSIVRASQYSEAAQLAHRSAWKVFMRLDDKRHHLSQEIVAAEFAGEPSCEIAERRCIGVMRDQIMERTHRSLEEQVSNELSLQDCIRKIGQQFGKQLMAGQGLKRIHAPKRLHAGKEFTADDLHKPLAINMDLR